MGFPPTPPTEIDGGKNNGGGVLSFPGPMPGRGAFMVSLEVGDTVGIVISSSPLLFPGVVVGPRRLDGVRDGVGVGVLKEEKEGGLGGIWLVAGTGATDGAKVPSSSGLVVKDRFVTASTTKTIPTIMKRTAAAMTIPNKTFFFQDQGPGENSDDLLEIL